MKGLWLLALLSSATLAQQPSREPTPPETTSPSSPPRKPEVIKEKEASESSLHTQPAQFEVRGFAASSFGLNLPRPGEQRNLIRGYAHDDRKLKLDGLNLDFQYGMDDETEFGFRLDTVLGGSYPRIDAAAGLFRDPCSGQTNTDFDIRQAFVRYQPDEHFTLDLGKFATHIGYEIMPGVDGKNPHATPAYGYTFNPFTHTGARLSYEVSEEVTLTGLVVLGADNFQDTNRSVSLGGQINWHPSEDLSFLFNVLDGPERAYNDRDRRRYYELLANYAVSEEVNLGLQAFTSTEEGLAPLRGQAWVNGMAFYLQTQLSPRFFLNFRQEFYNDPFGVRLGSPAQIRALTITPEYRLSESWALRLDLRFDKSTTPVFSGRDYQNTLFFQQTLNF